MARIIIMYFGSLKRCQKTCLTMKGDRVTLGPVSVRMDRHDQPRGRFLSAWEAQERMTI